MLYTLVGLASTALVLSITVPAVGGGWYGLCALSPAAGWYYYKNADRCACGPRRRDGGLAAHAAEATVCAAGSALP